ncbi:hypothetical protein CAPTEDRAFT_200679 [Capitella teleta]|uniref:LRRNT domain-containing protein n=1 Tax=Capitella teleta TaxID=283909 RepID=R7TG97_CAPTE|nr:hypothetical protein CAPTEDRAFT_200679 [Capitella teleta]|eukprot:ELT92512.1 hypothetical protein CAPTEDRAFT_200679 [Capitella teleta]
MGIFTLLYLVGYFTITSGCYNGRNRGLEYVPTDIPLNVSVILLRNNEIDSLPVGTFENYVDLLSLEMGGNNLMDISPSAFKGTKLEFLYLDRNSLTTFPDLSEIGHCLKELYLAYNDITEVSTNHISSLTVLKLLDLTGNNKLPKGLPFKSGFNNLLVLNLMDTRMTEINDELTNLQIPNLWISNGGFSGGISDLHFTGTKVNALLLRSMGLHTFPIFPNLARGIKMLDLTDNSFIEPLGDDDLGQLESISKLVLKKCHIMKFPDVTSLNKTLKELNVEMNSITTIPSNALDEMSRLDILRISNNPLQNFPSFAIRIKTLKSLYMERTNFVFSCQHASHFDSLGVIDLSDNSLDSIGALQCLNSPTRHVILKDNNISVIHIAGLPFLKTLQTINLHNNPIQCLSKINLKAKMISEIVAKEALKPF